MPQKNPRICPESSNLDTCTGMALSICACVSYVSWYMCVCVSAYVVVLSMS